MDGLCITDNCRAAGPTCHCGEGAVFAQLGDGCVEIIGFVKREQFGFIGKQDIDMVFDQMAKALAVSSRSNR